MGCGILILFASFRKNKENILHNSKRIPLLVMICGLLSAFAVFLFVGYVA
jgi:SNF family Na+-dependent transporter